jgi:hypothetical protein
MTLLSLSTHSPTMLPFTWDAHVNEWMKVITK